GGGGGGEWGGVGGGEWGRALVGQLDRAKSTMRYIPPNGTAGLARSRVRGPRRLPLPPARRMVSTFSMAAHSFEAGRDSAPRPPGRPRGDRTGQLHASGPSGRGVVRAGRPTPLSAAGRNPAVFPGPFSWGADQGLLGPKPGPVRPARMAGPYPGRPERRMIPDTAPFPRRPSWARSCMSAT